MESPPPNAPSDKRRKMIHPSSERGSNRKVLAERTVDDTMLNTLLSNHGTTPTRTEKPDEEYYDKRGAILSARKRTRSSIRQHRPKLSDDLDPGDASDQEIILCSGTPGEVPRTPNKNVESLKVTPEVRRSPRKHMSSVPTTKTGFSKLTISGSTIVSDKSSTLKRQGSFTILDPASGIPSDGTPRLQASLTSRHSALMLPGGTNLLQLSMSSAANLHNQASFLMNTSQSLNTNTKESPLPLTAIRGRFATPNTQKKTSCICFGRAQVCSKCLNRRPQRAPRAGTPGFRPPEVLLKFEHQTTAVDIWAAGVILLCILSRTYPFFRAPDDLTALAELLALFGTKAVQETANQYGKRLISSEQVPGQDLQLLCQTLAERKPSEYKNPEPGSSQCLATEQAVDLLRKILSLSSHERLTAKDALQHPFFED